MKAGRKELKEEAAYTHEQRYLSLVEISTHILGMI
jgi:hypothetical protein